MEHKILHLNLKSAKDLKKVNLFAKTEAYAVVSISGDPLQNQKAKTPVDREGGTNPAWNFSAELTFNESLARQNRLTLEIKLRCLKNLAVDKDIGSVQIPLGELLNQIGDGKSFQHVSYQVKKPSGRPKGAFNFSYKFTASVKSKVEPGYIAPAVGSTSASNYPAAYAPLQQEYPVEYGYGYPLSYGGYQQTQVGYGYPQQQSDYVYPPQNGYNYPPQNGYGYPPQRAIPVQKPGKSNLGMGAGLIGGALGGLLIGDMISDGFGF